MADVYVHIGLAKTGTTTIQSALAAASTALAEQGVLVPGTDQKARRNAVYDLTGRRIPGEPADSTAGAWNALVRDLDAWTGPVAVLSEELLSLATPRQVAHLVGSLAAHRVTVVVGLRDLSKTVPSAWQQEVRKGHTTSWEEYVAAVRDPASGPPSAGLAFWVRHDPLRILDVWEQHVPRDRIRLLTVPHAPGEPHLLLDRFADAASIPRDVLVAKTHANTSLGATQTEVLRRLNIALDVTRSHRSHLDLVQHGLVRGLKASPKQALALPPDDLAWAQRYTDTLCETLVERSYPVVGDLAELRPADPGPGASGATALSTEDLLACTEQAFYGLARSFVDLRGQVVPSTPAVSGATVRERMASRARAAEFELKVRILRRADHNRALAWLLRNRVRVRGLG